MTGSIGGIIPPGLLLTGTTNLLPGQPQPLANVALISLPPDLIEVGRPMLLEGVLITAPDGQGVARLQTALGDIILRANLPLAEGKNYLLQVPAGQPPQTALLLTPGLSPSGGTVPVPYQASQAAAQPQTNPTSQNTISENLPLPSVITPNITLGPTQPGVTVPGLFYQPGSFGESAEPALPQTGNNPATQQASPGFSLPNLASAITRNLLGRNIPLPVLPPAPTSIPMQQNTQPSAPTQPATISTVPITPQPPQVGQVTILSILPPHASNPPLVENQIAGTVIQQTPQGQPIVSTPGRVIVLQTTTSPPVGSHLILNIQVAGGNQPVQEPAFPAADLVTDWPSLSAASQALGTTEAGISSHAVLQTILPQLTAGAGHNVAGNLLFLLTALRLGDVRALIGDAPLKDLVKIGRKDLADALQDDFKSLAQPDYEPVEPGWRGHSVPVQVQGHINMVHFFTRPAPLRVRKEDVPEDATDPEGTRFLVDLELSALGPMQIEGRTTPKRLDVLVRTRTLLPTEVQQGLRDLYLDVLNRQNLNGGLSFQGTAEGWLALTPRRHPHGSGPITA